MSLWSRFANVFRGDRLSREIDEQLESHIQEAIEQGRGSAEVRKAFGSALRQRDESRDVKAIAWLDALRADGERAQDAWVLSGSRVIRTEHLGDVGVVQRGSLKTQ